MKKTKRNRNSQQLAAMRRHNNKRTRRKLARKLVQKEVAPSGTIFPNPEVEPAPEQA